MTITLDDVSEPGSWGRAIDRGCLSEFRTHGADSAVDDEMPIYERAATRAAVASLPVTPAGVADIDRYLREERASDCQPDRLGREVKSVPVHGEDIDHAVR